MRLFPLFFTGFSSGDGGKIFALPGSLLYY
jgi:hypothetical protein